MSSRPSRGARFSRVALTLLVLGAGVPAQESKEPASNTTSGTESAAAPRGRTEGSPIRGGSEIISLGNGRGRLRVLQTRLETLSVSESGQVALDPPSAAEAWLRATLVARWPDFDPTFLTRVWASNDDRGLAATRERWIVIEGNEADLPAAERFIRDYLALGSTPIRWTLRSLLVRRGRFPSDAPYGQPRVEALSAEALKDLLDRHAEAVAASPFPVLRYESNSGREVLVRELRRHRHLRDWEIDEVSGESFPHPVFGFVQEGVQGSLFATLLPGATELAARIDLGFGRLRRPIESLDISLPTGRRVSVERPEVDATRWSQDDLRLLPGESGFLVRNLAAPGVQDPEMAPSEELVLIVSLDIDRLPAAGLLGTVLGVDVSRSTAFVRVTGDGKDSQPGQHVIFVRSGLVVGSGQILEILGSHVTARVESGVVRSGDELR